MMLAKRLPDWFIPLLTLFECVVSRSINQVPTDLPGVISNHKGDLDMINSKLESLEANQLSQEVAKRFSSNTFYGARGKKDMIASQFHVARGKKQDYLGSLANLKNSLSNDMDIEPIRKRGHQDPHNRINSLIQPQPVDNDSGILKNQNFQSPDSKQLKESKRPLKSKPRVKRSTSGHWSWSKTLHDKRVSPGTFIGVRGKRPNDNELDENDDDDAFLNNPLLMKYLATLLKMELERKITDRSSMQVPYEFADHIDDNLLSEYLDYPLLSDYADYNDEYADIFPKSQDFQPSNSKYDLLEATITRRLAALDRADHDALSQAVMNKRGPPPSGFHAVRGK